MAVVVNKQNKVDDVMYLYLARVFSSRETRWPDSADIVLVMHKHSGGETKALEHLLNKSADEIKALIAQNKDTFFAASDAEVLQHVRTTPGAIGLVDVHSVDKTVNVLRIDDKLPKDPYYPVH